MSAALGTVGVTVAIGAVVAIIAYVVATKLSAKKKVPAVVQKEEKPKTAIEHSPVAELDDEEYDVAASPGRVQFEAPQESFQETSEVKPPVIEETMIMEDEKASHEEGVVVEEVLEDVPEGAIDCTAYTGLYGDAVNEALRSWRSQGPSALGSIVPLADTPASGSTRTDGHRWFATALVAAIPLTPSNGATDDDDEVEKEEGDEDNQLLVSSGVCRLVLVNDTLSLYALDEIAEVAARRNEGRIADQHFLSIKTGGAIPDTTEDALDSPYIHNGDVLIGRLVLSNDDALAVEPTFVQSHITGAFTTTIRLAQPKSAPASSNSSESNNTQESGHICVVQSVPVAEDIVVYGPHFSMSHTSVSISFETYYEAQLWYRMLVSRTATIDEDESTNNAAVNNNSNADASQSLFNELGYSSVLTAAFGRGVLAHGAKLVEDLLSAHDYIYDACAMAEGADINNNNHANKAGVKVPRGFRMKGPNDYLIEPETAIIPPRAVLLHARQTTLNSLSTRASHRSCCGVGMLPTGDNDDADNQSVVLNLVDLRVGQSCDAAGAISETLAKDYGLAISRSKKATNSVSVANSIVSIASTCNDVLVCGSISSECTFQPPRDYAFLEALIKVHIYNSGKPDPVENDDVVAARKKFSEPTTDPEEPVQVAYAYVRITNISGTSVVIASDESDEPQPLWAGFRCSPAASVQCHLLAPQYHAEFFDRLPAGTYDEALFPQDDQREVIERTIAHSVRTALFEQVTLPHCVEVPSYMVNDAGSISLPPHSHLKERQPRMIHDLIEDAVAEIFPAIAPLAPAAGEDEDAEPAYYAFRYPADKRQPSVDTEPSVQEEMFIHPTVDALCLSAIRETSSAPPSRAETPVTTIARDSRLKALLPPSYRDRVVTPKRGLSISPSNCMVVELDSVVESMEPVLYNEPAPLPPLPVAPVAKEVRNYPRRDYIFTTPRHHRPAAMQSPLRRLIFSGESPRAGSTPLNADDSAMLRRYKELRSEMLVDEGREEELPLGTYEEKLIYAKLLEKERKRATEEEEARFRQREKALEDALTASRNAAISEQQRNLAEQREREAERERKATEAMERLAALEDELARTKEESNQRQIQMEIRRAAEEEARRQAEREEADRAEATLRHEEEAATLQRISNTERALEAVRNTLDSMTSAPPRQPVSPSRASSSSSVSSSLFDSSMSGSSMDSSNLGTPTRSFAENPEDTPRTRRKSRRRARHDARKIKAKRLRRLLKQKGEEEKARLVSEIERQRKEDAERQDRLAEAERGLRELQAKVFESNRERDRSEEERRRAAQEEELKTKIEMLEAQARAMGTTKDAEKEEALMKLMEELAEERRSSEREREDRRLRDQAEATKRDEERAKMEAERRGREMEDRKRIEDTERALALLLAQQEREVKERDRRERENEKARKEEIRLAAEAAKAAALAAAEEERRRYREEEERKSAQRDASQDIGDDGTKDRIAAMENAVISLQSQLCQQADDTASNATSKRTPRGSRVPTPRTIRRGSASKPPLPPGAISRSNSITAPAPVPQESEKDRLKKLKHEEKIQIRAAKAKEKEDRKSKRRADDSLVEQIMRDIHGEDDDMLDTAGYTPASVTRDTNTLFGDMASPAPTNMTINAHDLESPVPETTAEPTAKTAEDETKPASEPFDGSDSGYEYDGVRYSRSQPMGHVKDVSVNPEDLGSDHVLTHPKHIEAAETKLSELFGGDVSSSIELVGDEDALLSKGFERNDYILTFNGSSINGRQGLLYHVYHSFCVTEESSLVTVSVLRTNGTILDVEVGDDILKTGDIALDSTNGQATIEGLLKEFVQHSSRPTSRSRARTGSKHENKESRRASRSESRNNSITPVVENGGGEANDDIHMDSLVTPNKAHKEKKDKGDKKPKADKAEKSKKSKKEKKDKKNNRSPSHSSHSAGFFERVESAVKDVVE